MTPAMYQELVRDLDRERTRQMLRNSRARAVRHARLRRAVAPGRGPAAAGA